MNASCLLPNTILSEVILYLQSGISIFSITCKYLSPGKINLGLYNSGLQMCIVFVTRIPVMLLMFRIKSIMNKRKMLFWTTSISLNPLSEQHSFSEPPQTTQPIMYSATSYSKAA